MASGPQNQQRQIKESKTVVHNVPAKNSSKQGAPTEDKSKHKRNQSNSINNSANPVKKNLQIDIEDSATEDNKNQANK